MLKRSDKKERFVSEKDEVVQICKGKPNGSRLE